MTETEEQKIIVAWFRDTWPEYAHCLRVSQWGEVKGRSRREAAIRRAKAKGQGAVDGESDIAILLGSGEYNCLLVEYKAGDGKHPTSQAQLDYIKAHNSTGNCAIVAKGIDICKAAISQYMEGKV